MEKANSAKLTALEQQLDAAMSKFNEFYTAPESEIQKVASVQAFEFTYELAWKYLREALKATNQEYFSSPKAVFKVAGKVNILTKQQVEKWIDYTKLRNLTVHMYSADVADEIFSSISNFVRDVEQLRHAISRYTEVAL